MRCLVVLPLMILALAGSVRPVRAQSLADVARKESERRKAIKDSGKTISNKDLPNTPSSASAPADTAKPAPAPDTAQPPAEPGGPGGPGGDDKAKTDDKTEAKDQKYWGGRMRALQSSIDRDQTFADALQTQINSLTNDFVSRDDPAQRAVIAQNKQKAIDELARLKQAIVDDKKAVTNLEEEARHAGVPPGWLR